MAEAQKELVLAANEYAYMQDQAKGNVLVYVGETTVTQTGQYRPIRYDANTATFKPVDRLEEAVCKHPIAVEGFYLVLLNPSDGNRHPSAGQGVQTLDGKLDVGRRINIPGPTMFALWPGQTAESVRGHHLRSNQYLLVRVYNDEEARKNWSRAIVRTTTGEGSEEGDPVVTSAAPDDMTVGKLYIIKGTDVSFYIPPTGVTVVKDNDGNYVREALSLERLEYCILVNENGEKRYPKGPAVVFPEPTERFVEWTKKGQTLRKARATELNEIQGLHLKVISDHVGAVTKEHPEGKYKAGDELFITGKETAIYFPKEEHSLIRYDGRSRHFATAVPAGEARYVLNRMDGRIRMAKGPDMLLPDPRTEVIVRRVLSDKQSDLWYPGNSESLQYNRMLREIMSSTPTTRAGAVSEGDYERGRKGRREKVAIASAMPSSEGLFMNTAMPASAEAVMADEFSRASTYTQPRTVTLDTKYQGVPVVDIWTGYAVMVVSKTGDRHVEIGPKTIMLEYDESLEVLELSTGKPKTTDKRLKTVYLRVANNKISDIVRVETADHVQVDVGMSYRVSFTGDPSKWFDVENYVKYMCDHCRSVLKNAARKTKIADFYATSEDFVRDTLLGVKGEDGERPGMAFKENGMHVSEIEVLGVHITDSRIQGMLEQAQHSVVRSNIDLQQASHELDVHGKLEEISRQRIMIDNGTESIKFEMQLKAMEREIHQALQQVANELKKHTERAKAVEAHENVTSLQHNRKLEREKNAAEQNAIIKRSFAEIEAAILNAHTSAVVDRFSAAQDGFSEALLALSSNETMAKVAESLSVQHIIGGKDFVEVIGKVFAGSALEPMLNKVVKRIEASVSNGRPSKKDKPQQPAPQA